MAHRLVLKDVEIHHAGRRLVAVSAAVEAGEVLSLMGPSGTGKSSLLAFIAGFLEPALEACGCILVDEIDVTHLAPERRHIGLLFQDALLFPHLSVGGNLLFALPHRAPNRETRMHQALASVGLAGFADRDPAGLSGGERARVALQRLLLSEPRAVLLDEPFSRLDATLRGDIRRLVFARLKDAGLPAILVTHDAGDAEAAGGRIIDIAAHDNSR